MSDEDALKGEDVESGTGAGGGLPDSGIEGKGDGTGEGGKTGEGTAGPASGTTEGDDAVGIV
ncbi:MAG: hypothetical protein QOI73_1071 [Solirubrobacteraceae bacterium]|nr:hypothetical protein [Solirubrobacteraceae bacterium]